MTIDSLRMKFFNVSVFVNSLTLILILGSMANEVLPQPASTCSEQIAEIKTGTGKFPIYFSPDGNLVTQGGSKLKLWDAKTGILYKEFRGGEKSESPVAFSPDGLLIATGTSRDNVQIWDVRSGNLLHTLKGGYSEVLAISFSIDGKFVAASGMNYNVFGIRKDGKARVWEVRSGNLISSFKPDFMRVDDIVYSSIAFSPTSNIIAAAFEDRVGLWDSESGKLLNQLIDPSQSIENQKLYQSSGGIIGKVGFSPDGKIVITNTFYDGTTKLWDVDSGKLIFDTEQNSYFYDFSPTGNYFALGGKDNTTRIWSFAEKKEVKLLTAHKKEVRRVSYNYDGTLLLTSDSKNTVLWKTNDWSVLQRIEGEGYSIFNPKDNSFATIRNKGLNNTVHLWKVNCN